MKYLIIALLCLVYFIGYTNTATADEVRDELLRRSSYLTTLVTGEIKLQKFEGQTLVAEGLTAELETLIRWTLEVRAAENVSQSELLNLEEQLRQIENRLAGHLRAIGVAFVRKQEIEFMLTILNELLMRTSETVVRLKATNRSVEARALESEELQLIQLEVAILATQNATELRRLQEYLVEFEYRLREILNGVDSGVARRKRALKDEVLMRANELLILANRAITAFRAQNRVNAVELIQQSERTIQELMVELNNATLEDDVQRLADRLLAEEFLLTNDLQRLGRPVDVQEFKLLLLTGVDGLHVWVNQELIALRAENRLSDVALLEGEERLVAQLVGQLSAANTSEELVILEQRLYQAEARLYEQLMVLSRPEAFRRALTMRAEEIAVRMTIAIRNLILQNRTLEAEGLRLEELTLIRLDVELRDASTIEEIQAIEQRLLRVEARIEQELRSINGVTLSKRHSVQESARIAGSDAF